MRVIQLERLTALAESQIDEAFTNGAAFAEGIGLDNPMSRAMMAFGALSMWASIAGQLDQEFVREHGARLESDIKARFRVMMREELCRG